MADKKSKYKSDSDMITEAVMAATKKRLDLMSGDEMKAEADRMAAMDYPAEMPEYYPWGTEAQDQQIRNWERMRKKPFWYGEMAPAPAPAREQPWGPWEKGQSRFGHSFQKPPYPVPGTEFPDWLGLPMGKSWEDMSAQERDSLLRLSNEPMRGAQSIYSYELMEPAGPAMTMPWEKERQTQEYLDSKRKQDAIYEKRDREAGEASREETKRLVEEILLKDAAKKPKRKK